jgi:hypothetical protein
MQSKTMKTTSKWVGTLAVVMSIAGLAGCKDDDADLELRQMRNGGPTIENPKPGDPGAPGNPPSDPSKPGDPEPGVWSGNRATVTMNFINNRSNLVADYAKIENEPVWRAVNSDCKVQKIDFKAPPKVTRMDAGELTAKGSVGEVKAKLDQQQRYFASSDTIIAQPNEMIVWSWTGAFMGVPPGTSSVARPEKITFTSPIPNEVQVSPDSDLTYAFTGGGNSWVGVTISQSEQESSTTVQCRFPASSGIVTLPKALWTEFKPNVPQTFMSLNTFNDKTEMMGDWQVNTTASEPLVSAAIKF